VRKITGSARIIEHDTPFPEKTGFSASCAIFEGSIVDPFTELALRLCLGAAPGTLSPSGGLDIAIAGSSTNDPAAALLANIVVRSADADENDALSVSGLADPVELAAEDGAVEVEVDEEKGEKTDPSTRFAFSREASFLSSTRNLDGFFGSRGGGGGLRSKGTKSAGRRVICIECGRCGRGRQGGEGSLAGCDFSKCLFVGV
jgi:hypothetical protein